MKRLFAVVIFNVVLAINAKEIDLLEEKCLKEIGINQKTFKAALEADVDDADMNVKCMIRCIMKEREMINEDGAIDAQKMAAALFTEPESVELIKPVIVSCIKGEDQSSEEKVESEDKSAEKKEEAEDKLTEKKEGLEDKSADKTEGEDKETEKKEVENKEAEKIEEEGKEPEQKDEDKVQAEQKEGEEEAKKELSCEEAYKVMTCVTSTYEVSSEGD